MSRPSSSGGAAAAPGGGGGGGGDSGAAAAAASAAAARTGRVYLRLYRGGDNAAVTRMWMLGFLEMADTAHARMCASPAVCSVFAAVAASAWALRAPAAVPACALAFGAALYTPLGLALYRALLWQGIRRQAHDSMRPEVFADKWLSLDPRGAAPGAWHEQRTAFFVAFREEDSTGEGEGAGAVPIGCVAVKFEHTLNRERLAGVAPAPGEASIWRLTTAPEARRLGVGRALMAAAEGFARRSGCRHVSLITGNEDSKKFYANIGYELESEPRACEVLFARSPLGVLGFVKARMLKARIAGRNIWHKELL